MERDRLHPLSLLAMKLDPALIGWEFLDLEPWQEAVLRNRGRDLICAARQQGKRLWIETELPTPEGWIRMADVKVGDRLFDEQGRPCTVTWAGPIEYGAAHRVSFSDGASLVADADHLWTTLDQQCRADMSSAMREFPADWATMRPVIAKRKEDTGYALLARRCEGPACGRGARILGRYCGGHYQQASAGKALTALKCTKGRRGMAATTITTEEMRRSLVGKHDRPGHFAANHAIPAAMPLQTDELPLPIDPYTLGVWLGDGDSAGPLVTGMDRAVFEKMFTNGSSIEFSASRSHDTGRAATYRVHALAAESRRKGTSPLRRLGLIRNKHIPPQYLRASVSQRMELLRGLMDTDGSANEVTSSVCEFGTTSERLAADFCDLASSLGIIVRAKESAARINGRTVGRRWRIKFTPPFDPFSIPRKSERIRFDNRKGFRTRLRFVHSVEPVPSVPMRCIQVDSPSRLYLAGRAMIPTHNSTVIALKVLWETLFLPYSFVLLFSASEGQSKELFQKMLAFYAVFRDLFPPAQESEMRLRLTTGNRVLALPSKARTVRGYSKVTRLVLDEAVEVSGDLYKSARPMLRRSKGSISAMSQAGFDEGWFFDEFMGSADTEEEAMEIKDNWTRQWVPANEAADSAYFADELRTMGPERFGREYRCRFTRLKTHTGNQPFAPELVKKVFSDEITPIFGGA